MHRVDEQKTLRTEINDQSVSFFEQLGQFFRRKYVLVLDLVSLCCCFKTRLGRTVCWQ